MNTQVVDIHSSRLDCSQRSKGQVGKGWRIIQARMVKQRDLENGKGMGFNLSAKTRREVFRCIWRFGRVRESGWLFAR